MSEDRITISTSGATLFVLLFSASLGYIEAGVKGLFAGIAGTALAAILSFLGIIPVIGVALYVYFFNEAAKWIKTGVAIKNTLTLPYYYGLLFAALFTIVSTFYLLKALE